MLAGRTLVLFCLIALAILLLTWNLWPPRADLPHLFLGLLVALGPLIVLAPAVILHNRNGYIWTGFVSLAYFVHGIAETMLHGPDRYFAVIEICISLMLFLFTAGSLRRMRVH